MTLIFVGYYIYMVIIFIISSSYFKHLLDVSQKLFSTVLRKVVELYPHPDPSLAPRLVWSYYSTYCTNRFLCWVPKLMQYNKLQNNARRGYFIMQVAKRGYHGVMGSKTNMWRFPSLLPGQCLATITVKT